MKNRLFFILLFFVSSISYGGGIKSAFEALDEYNYFKAKELFEKAEKREPSIACYGLSIIYLRNDNPFHNLDSAYTKITKSEQTYDLISPKKQEKYCAYKFDYPTLLKQRQLVSTALFNESVKENTELAFVQFLAKNPWANEFQSASYKRDSLAFETATNLNTSTDYNIFLNKYPQSSFRGDAVALFFKTQYQEATKSGKAADYASFIMNFPENPYNEEAQDSLFKLMTYSNTVEAYSGFIQQYPKNKNVNLAWKMLYRAYMKDFSLEQLEKFEQNYPQYPFPDELALEKKRINELLFPYKIGDKWGFINEEGKLIIPASFDGVDFFHEGIAVVSKNNHLGYINKGGKYIVEAQFDEANSFKEGVAVVQKEDEYGMLDRTGLTLLQLNCKDVTSASESRFFVEKDSLYLLYSIDKKEISLPRFTNVNDFENNRAVVAEISGWGVIDTAARMIIPFQYNKIIATQKGFVATKDSKTIYFSQNGDTLFAADSIEMSSFSEGKALVQKNNKIGVIDEKGHLIINYLFDTYPNSLIFGLFKNNHAKMYSTSAKKFGLIDTLGNWTIAPKFEEISFYSNLIAAKKQAYWEYFAPDLRKKFNRKFANAESFVGTSAVVIDEDKYGLLGENGEFLLPAEWDEIINLTPELYRLKNENGFLLADKMGHKLWEEYYERINLIDADLLQLFKDEKVYYYLINEAKFVGKSSDFE